MMRLLDPREGPVFLAHCSRAPWLVPSYAGALSTLVFRRVANQVRLRLATEPHRGLKIRPDWLPVERAVRSIEAPEPAEVGAHLALPAFENLGAPGFDWPESIPLPDDDPEAVLFEHRWSTCIVAALGDGAALEEALVEVERWLSGPQSPSHSAWETYSACERLVNLAVLVAMHPATISRLGAENLLRFFSETAAWIASRIEYYGPQRTNNHVINNARALVVAGAVLRDELRLAQGLAIFERVVPAMFDTSGFLRERSSHYQVVVTGWLLDARHFARSAIRRDRTRWESLDALAGRAADATSRLVGAIGDMDVHIGDISPDLHPRLSLARLRRLYPESLRPIETTNLSGRGCWLFAGSHSDSLAAALPLGDWPELYATHGHDDLGSFVWRRKGRTILADPGRGSYRAGASADQTSASAHNTLTVDGHGPLAGSVLRNGLWFPTPYAHAEISAGCQEEGFSITHNGFARLSGVGAHERTVELDGEGVRIRDTLYGDRKASLSLAWHFASGISREAGPAAQPDGTSVVIDVEVSNGAMPEVDWGTYPISSAYGRSEPAAVARCSLRCDLPVTISTRLRVMPCAV